MCGNNVCKHARMRYKVGRILDFLLWTRRRRRKGSGDMLKKNSSIYAAQVVLHILAEIFCGGVCVTRRFNKKKVQDELVS